MAKTPYELNDKAKDILSQLEGLEFWEAEAILDLAKQELRHNAVIKISTLVHVSLPSKPHKQEMLQK